MNIVLPDPSANPYLSDLKRLGKISIRARNIYHDEHLEKTPCFEGVEATLHVLKKKGFSLNVLSNKPYRSMIALLKQLNLNVLFDVIVGPETTGHPKPDPSGMKHIMDCCSCLPEEMLMVGDTRVDLQTADYCQIDSVLVSYGYGDVDALKKEFSPWAVIDRFSELERLLG